MSFFDVLWTVVVPAVFGLSLIACVTLGIRANRQRLKQAEDDRGMAMPWKTVATAYLLIAAAYIVTEWVTQAQSRDTAAYLLMASLWAPVGLEIALCNSDKKGWPLTLEGAIVIISSFVMFMLVGLTVYIDLLKMFSIE